MTDADLLTPLEQMLLAIRRSGTKARDLATVREKIAKAERCRYADYQHKEEYWKERCSVCSPLLKLEREERDLLLLPDWDDDTPRLALADELEEHDGDGPCGACGGDGKVEFPGMNRVTYGNPYVVRCEACHGTGRVGNRWAAWAELIRTQVELARTPTTIRAGNRCPECGNPGRWRSGVGFEHEKICQSCPTNEKPLGSVVWEPGEEYTPRKAVELRRRERELLDQNYKAWVPFAGCGARSDGENLGGVGPLAVFRRGFIDEIHISWPAWVCHADAILAAPRVAAPVVRLTSRPWADAWDRGTAFGPDARFAASVETDLTGTGPTADAAVRDALGRRWPGVRGWEW